MAPFKPQVATLVSSVLSPFLDELLMETSLLQGYTVLASEVFGTQAWPQTEHHFNVGLSPFGVAEVRYLLQGSHICAGVKYDNIPRGALQLKLEHVLIIGGMREFLARAGPKTGVGTLFEKHGSGSFFKHNEPDTCFVIPAGYVCVIAGTRETGEAGSSGLRAGPHVQHNGRGAASTGDE
eukprot:NODE_13518_length_1161_cov_3.064797.p2 GENE.NODE_13518_length_1161_cov_3.064797~~NODE_13518_length_1161_cov_3.064797.p2  ORF type:complete len:180 (-),score=41.08 NODE_13518_length_1161_cov_3.064797:97-636(-)